MQLQRQLSPDVTVYGAASEALRLLRGLARLIEINFNQVDSRSIAEGVTNRDEKVAHLRTVADAVEQLLGTGDGVWTTDVSREWMVEFMSLLGVPWSAKDRVVAVALAAAREFGFRVLACPSTGNLANAVAAAAARAGWDSVVLVPSTLERAKVLTTAVYDGTLIAVDGNYDDVNRLATELAAEHEDWAFVNVNVRPYYGEGSKTLGFEVAEQLGWRLPEQIVVPIASGSQLTKVDRAFREFGELGLVEPTPYRVFGAQANGCSPVASAFKAGLDVVQPVRPETIARSLAIGAPADGPYVLDTVRRTGGAIEDVTDQEIVEGIRLLARTEGIFTETAGGVTVATAKKLIESGQLDPDAETVLLITGDGLKTLDAISDHVGPKATVPPTAQAVHEVLGQPRT
ncbi:threonine synthase [Actinoalloteichus caeruleus]|uniref:threonine synthase n=1 Tax=Actinoalloteichus cyanogriseus TaxID=2893586 RepID=UPI003BB8AE56